MKKKKECLHCELPLSGGRADKKFCDSKCRNGWNNALKSKTIGKAKITGMLILLNKVYWKLPPLEGEKLLNEASDIPFLPGKFRFEQSSQSIVLRTKRLVSVTAE